MRLLLDTHVFLWLAGAPERLTTRALDACKNRQNPIYLSVVSAWEIQIKSQLGKLTLDDPLAELVREQQAVNGLRILGVDLSHVLELEALPSFHGDPFDRLLVAQARVEDLHLVTSDRKVRRYPTQSVW